MYQRDSRRDGRRQVHRRIRKRVAGTSQRPRLAVFRSLGHIYTQVIDDSAGRTLVSASTVGKKAALKSGGNVAAAKAVGKQVAEKALQAGIKEVVFDRGGHKYHGRVKAVAEAAREAGLKL